jgi:anti-sigma factor (TIGR02949 family)
MTREIRCEDVIEKLLEYLDRELDATEERDFARHLETCRGCFTRAEFERRLRAKVRETGAVKAPHSLRRRIRAMVARY